MKITVLQASIHYKYVCFNSVLLCIGKGDFLQFDTFYYFSALKIDELILEKDFPFFFFSYEKHCLQTVLLYIPIGLYIGTMEINIHMRFYLLSLH